MQSHFTRGVSKVRLAAMFLVAATATGCQVKSQNAPELSGPSELSHAQVCKDVVGGFCTIAVTATPDHLPQDGSSQSAVTATVLDGSPEPQPVRGLALRWSVTSSDGSLVTPSAQITPTDALGRATVVITAPAAPATMPTSPVTLRIEVEPVGSDSQAVFGDPTIPRRSVVVELVPPQGIPAANRLPIAAFTVVPSVANVNETITLNASTTTDEGVACGSRCSYLWNFGDSTNLSTDTGIVVTRKYPSPGFYTITLTVVDDRGGVASTTRSVSVAGPAAPTALFSTTQTVVGGPVTFNATTSTVGAGATIVDYAWEFGDGGTTNGASPLAQHAYGAAGTYLVKLTITDDLGRTSTRIVTVAVT